MQQRTKLDLREDSPDYNNAGVERDVAQNVATIILTPASLNTTSAAQVPGIALPAPRPPTAAQEADNNGRGNDNGTTAGIGRRSAAEQPRKPPNWCRCWQSESALISEHLALLGVFLACWAIGYILFPVYSHPDSAIMRIAFLFLGAHTSGIIVSMFRLPDMLGMLFFGVLYTNVGLADFAEYNGLESFLREMALINIMLLAGLGLDGKAFRKLNLIIMRLTLIPTIAEVACIALLGHWTLAMPWLWSLLLGLVVTAVSPNVVVTVMLKLKEERLGLNNGIHTLIYAMTACNDVVAIFLFNVILAMIFSTGPLAQQLLQGPIGIGIGVAFGCIYGLALHFLPTRNAKYANGLRFILTVLGGVIAELGSKAINYPSAGTLGCVTIAFVAAIGWKRDEKKQLEEQEQLFQKQVTVPERLDLMWKFLKPVSFSLIGKEINFAVLDGRVVSYGALLILSGSLFRLAFAYLSTYGGNLSKKERAYITISGFPKATVQAALGPVALDLARSLKADEGSLALANQVLIISVLAIILTAPLGAILMLRLAPVCLKRGEPEEITQREVSHMEVRNQDVA